MKSKNFILLFIFGLFLFLLPGFTEGACPLFCSCDVLEKPCVYSYGTLPVWADHPEACLGSPEAVEKIGITGNIEKEDPWCCPMTNCSVNGNKCKMEAFSSGSNGQSCTAIDRCWDWVCSDCVKSGKWDASQSQCVSCNGKIEQWVRGNTSAIYAGCSGFPSGCNSEGNTGNGKCESACGANTACDEVTDENQCTVGKYCEALGRNCLSGDKCSGCVCISGAKPTISFSPSSFTFAATLGGSNPANQTLEVWNSGTSGTTLNWSVSDNATWLTLSPTSGSSTGEHDSVTLSVNISGMTAGSYSATITISDPNASNSPQTVSVTLTITAPDLIISANSYSPTSPVAGDSMTFTGTVKNQGNAPAGATSYTRLRIDINNDGTYDVTPSNKSTSNLAAGATETETWSSVWTAEAGTHKYEICADATAVVTESNETNNCVTQTFTVTATQPDLIISANSYSPTSPVAGDSMSFSGTVKNQGGSSAGATSYTRLRIDKNNDGTYDVTPSNQSTSNLAAGATETETWSSVWTAEAGTHKYEICADVTGTVTESNENNNCVTQTFTVTATPVFDFSISISPTSGSVVQGNSISATVNTTLTSGSTQSVSFSASGLPSGASASFSPTSCNPSCSSTMTINTAGTTPTGTYSINVCGTGGGQTHCVTYGLTVTEAGVAINPPSVTTNAATNITQTSATLNGTLNSMGNAPTCYVWFEYGPTTAMGNTTPVQTKTTLGAFWADISGLTANTTYYFEAFAKNGGSW